MIGFQHPLPENRLVWIAAIGTPLLLYVYWRSCKSKPPGTDFNSFLKSPDVEVPPAASKKKPKQSTCFDSFLKGPAAPIKDSGLNGITNGTSTSNSVPEILQPAGPSAENVIVTVLYGTEYGFSKEIAEKLSEKLKHGSQYWYDATIAEYKHIPYCFSFVSVDISIRSLSKTWLRFAGRI